MIIYVNSKDKNLYADLLDQLFKKRYEIFKLGYNWDIPTYDCYEMDEYDNHLASYILYLDQDKNLIGSVRFNPTIHTSMVQDHFRDYCYPDLPEDQRLIKLPRRKDVLEITRLFCKPKKQNRIGFFNHETLELLAAMIEVSLSQDITSLLSILEQPWRNLFAKLSWELEDIGLVPAPKNQHYHIVLFPIHKNIYNHIKKLINVEGLLICDSVENKTPNDNKLYQLMKMKCLSTV